MHDIWTAIANAVTAAIWWVTTVHSVAQLIGTTIAWGWALIHLLVERDETDDYLPRPDSDSHGRNQGGRHGAAPPGQETR